MPLKHADIVRRINDLWNGIGDGARLDLIPDGSRSMITHPHGKYVSVDLTRVDLDMTIDQFASLKLVPALTELKEKVQ